MGWQLVAQGSSFEEIEALVANKTLNPGDRMRVEMSCPGYSSLFDIAGAEQAFSPWKPAGTSIIDVWGEGGSGYVLMEVDQITQLFNTESNNNAISVIPLFTVLGAIFYWGSIAIAIGIVLAAIVTLIRVFMYIEDILTTPWGLVIIAGAIMGIYGISRLSKGG